MLFIGDKRVCKGAGFFQARGAEYLVTDLEARHAGPDSADDAREIVTKSTGKLPASKNLDSALADAPIHWVDGCCLHPDANLAATRLLKFDLLEMQFVGTAIRVILNASHGMPFALLSGAAIVGH